MDVLFLAPKPSPTSLFWFSISVITGACTFFHYELRTTNYELSLGKALDSCCVVR